MYLRASIGALLVFALLTPLGASSPPAATCLKPFAIPHSDLADGAGATGTQLTLKAGDPHDAPAPGFYLAVALPGSSGASDFRSNIEDCADVLLTTPDTLVTEPGNLAGPAEKGALALMALDPAAYWDNVQGRVVGSSFSSGSPRMFLAPVFDDSDIDAGRQSGRRDLQIVAFVRIFLEDVRADGTIVGRTMPLAGETPWSDDIVWGN
jgi:hypothetical protein